MTSKSTISFYLEILNKMGRKKRPQNLQNLIFWIFRIFGGTFTALTGGTVGVPRCHSLRLYMRYDLKKNWVFFEKLYFFDEKYFSKDCWKIENFKKSTFFEKLKNFRFFNNFRKSVFLNFLIFQTSFEKYLSSKK